MLKLQRGSLRLFQWAGIQVYLHWSWFVVAALSIMWRREHYSSLLWNTAEYVALFVIVLLHEFGHALACRQVGGQANQIVLWPLGGVAFVAPPQRPGATLWAIAAGPLVNVVLLPLAGLAVLASHWLGLDTQWPDFHAFLWALVLINILLLVFNLLPIYPLDGGQILRSLLWFFIGRARSLIIASFIGMIGGAGLMFLAFKEKQVWFGIMAFFIMTMCRRSWQQGRAMSQLEKMPTRPEFACPVCRIPPPIGTIWRCHQCGIQFDAFATAGVCPQCAIQADMIPCVHCGNFRPMSEWTVRA